MCCIDFMLLLFLLENNQLTLNDLKLHTLIQSSTPVMQIVCVTRNVCLVCIRATLEMPFTCNCIFRLAFSTLSPFCLYSIILHIYKSRIGELSDFYLLTVFGQR